ncbi:MAG: sulfotransferase, partial [Devosia sp.]
SSGDFAGLRLLRYYNLYRGLMRHWNEVLPGEIFDLQYEDLVADPGATSQALFDFCGLEWSPEVLDFHERRGEVRTASVSQVRRPIYKDSVDRSARYGAKLDPLRAALAEWDEA